MAWSLVRTFNRIMEALAAGSSTVLLGDPPSNLIAAGQELASELRRCADRFAKFVRQLDRELRRQDFEHTPADGSHDGRRDR
jgi:hypothetical protein